MTAASTPTAASEHDIAVDPAPLHKTGVNPEHIRIGGRQIERLLFLFSGDSYSDRSDIRSGQSPLTAKKALSVVSKPFCFRFPESGKVSPLPRRARERSDTGCRKQPLPHLFIGKPRSARSAEHLAAAIMRIGKYPDFHVSSPSLCRLQPRVRPCSPDARCRSAPAAGIPAEKCRPHA